MSSSLQVDPFVSGLPEVLIHHEVSIPRCDVSVACLRCPYIHVRGSYSGME